MKKAAFLTKISFLLILICLNIKAQDFLPPYISIETNDYKKVGPEIGPQNFGIIQDKSGQILFCNSDCILSFDGHFWKKINGTSKKGLRCLVQGEKSIIYVGGNQQIGYLESSLQGEFSYNSLLEFLPLSERKFGIIWEAVKFGESIAFRTSQKVLIFNTNSRKFFVFNSKTSIQELIPTSKKCFIRELSQMVVEIDSKGHKEELGNFESKKQILTAISLRNAGQLTNSYLIEKNEKTIAIFNKDFQEIPVDYEIGKEIIEKTPRKIIESSFGEYSIPTKDGGLYILNPNGSLRFIINKSNILPDNGINSIFLDHENGLWISSDLGITRIEMDSPLSFLPHQNGFDGVVTDIEIQNEYFYVCTSSKLFFSKIGKSLQPSINFRPIQSNIGQAFQLLNCEGDLLVATWNGLFRLQGEEAIQLNSNPTTTMAWDAQNKCLYLTLEEGIFKIIKKGSTYSQPEKVCNLKFIAQFSELDNKGRFWVSDYAGNAAYINTFDPIPAWVSYFNPSNGLYLGWNKPILYKKELFWTNPISILSFKEDNSKFIQKNPFKLRDSTKLESFYILEESQTGEIWISDQGKFAKLRKDRDGYDYFDYSPSNKLPNSDSWALLIKNNNLWFSTNEGLVHYDINKPQPKLTKPIVLINGIILDGKIDKGLFEGTISQSSPPYSIEIPQTPNLLKINISSPNFNTLSSNLFSYKMVGLQSEWTNWTTDNTLKFHALPSGTYTLSIKTKNQNNQESNPLNVTIIIKNPWYKSKKTLGIILLLILSLLTLYLQTKNRKLKRNLIKIEEELICKNQELMNLNSKILTSDTKPIDAKQSFNE